MFGALKPGFQSLATLKLVNVFGKIYTYLNQKEQLQHRTVSLRQHGFLVLLFCYCFWPKSEPCDDEIHRAYLQTCLVIY